ARACASRSGASEPMDPLATSRGRHSERGAILVLVAVSLLTFTLISALVIDYGMIVVSRHQVQTATDAAAHAGASALAWDDYTDRAAGGPAVEAAIAVAAK